MKMLTTMLLASAVDKGGPGSGCHGDNCGRPASGERSKTKTPAERKAERKAERLAARREHLDRMARMHEEWLKDRKR